MIKMLKSAFAVLILLSSGYASAVEITLHFAGALTNITDEYGFLQGQFLSGTPFEGEIGLETNTPESGVKFIDPTSGTIYNVVKYFRVSVNGYLFDGSDSGSSSLAVLDDYASDSKTSDALIFESPNDYTPPISGMGAGTVVSGGYLALFDYTHSAHSSMEIPTNISFSKYDTATFGIWQANINTQQGFMLNGVVTSVSQVPEPEVYSMMLIGFGLVGAMARRKKCQNLL